MLKRLVIGALALACSTPFVIAQDDTSKGLAEELLLLMEIPQNIEKSFQMIKQMQAAQFQQMAGGVAGTEEVASLQDEIMDMISAEMSWDNLKDDYIGIYSDTFTADELRGIIEFYKSPVGQKFVEKMPELQRRSMELSQKQTLELMPKIQSKSQEVMQKVRAASGDAPSVPTPAGVAPMKPGGSAPMAPPAPPAP